MYDLIGVGEAMLRFTPPNGLRIEQTLSFDIAVGGAELNVAVAMSRIGARTAWLSKLPDTSLGHIIGNQARIHGVDTSHIIWTDAAASRLGLFFLESGAVPRAGEIVYDRKDSAASTMATGRLGLAGAAASDARPAYYRHHARTLARVAARMTFAAVGAAKEAGCAVACDLNYRSKLWTPEEAAACFRELSPEVDVILSGSSDLKIIFGMTGKPAELARWLREEFGVPIASVGKRRGNAASGMQGRRSVVATEQGVFTSPGAEFQPLDPIGAGDAYARGLPLWPADHRRRGASRRRWATRWPPSSTPFPATSASSPAPNSMPSSPARGCVCAGNRGCTVTEDSGGDNSDQGDARLSQHPVDALIRDLIRTRRPHQTMKYMRIIDQIANAPFDERILPVRGRYQGLSYRGRTLTQRAPALFLHLVQRVVVEEQWADGIREQEYLTDIRTAIRDDAARLCIYRRRGGSLAAILVSNRMPLSRCGLGALPLIFVVYSADRGRIISGYQASSLATLSIAEDVQWLK